MPARSDAIVDADVAVVGAGPAGRALAARLAHRGASVALVDPAPTAPWHQTLSLFTRELPGWLDESVLATPATHPVVRVDGVARTQPWPFGVVDTTRLADTLHDDRIRPITSRATWLGDDAVALDDGRLVRAAAIIDARGAAPPACASAPGPWQAAYGLVLPADALPPETVFMDWTPAGVDDGDPRASFCYVVPVAPGLVLVEETILVTAAPVPDGLLPARLAARLTRLGVTAPAHREERVAIPMTPGLVRGGFGVRGGTLHACTGFSVGSALLAADATAEAIVAGRRPPPATSRGVRALRAAGLRTLLALDGPQTIRFFSAFFTVGEAHRAAFLFAHDDTAATAAAMAAVYAALPAELRTATLRASAARRTQARPV